jgi:hypothetical protein
MARINKNTVVIVRFKLDLGAPTTYNQIQDCSVESSFKAFFEGYIIKAGQRSRFRLEDYREQSRVFRNNGSWRDSCSGYLYAVYPYQPFLTFAPISLDELSEQGENPLASL